uniref:Uncharacterized protein n=1 Tax=Sphaerodactylus townsendi TaxID=933632 RepID=A0ACB8ECU6_9SAUR
MPSGADARASAAGSGPGFGPWGGLLQPYAPAGAALGGRCWGALQAGGGGAWAAPCRLCLAEQLRERSRLAGPAAAAAAAAGALLPLRRPMMCLESDGAAGGGPPGCGGRFRVPAAGDDEEEDDGGGGGGGGGGGDRGCCGRGGEVQTLSGAVRAPKAAPAAAPSLGRARVAAAGILSVGNVLNYLDRYTVAGIGIGGLGKWGSVVLVQNTESDWCVCTSQIVGRVQWKRERAGEGLAEIWLFQG